LKSPIGGIVCYEAGLADERLRRPERAIALAQADVDQARGGARSAYCQIKLAVTIEISSLQGFSNELLKHLLLREAAFAVPGVDGNGAIAIRRGQVQFSVLVKIRRQQRMDRDQGLCPNRFPKSTVTLARIEVDLAGECADAAKVRGRN